MKNAPFFDRIAAILSKILNFLFVPKCVVCDDVLLEKEIPLCPECLKLWDSARKTRCPVCSKTARACTCRPVSLTNGSKLGERYLSSLVFFGKPDSEETYDLAVRQAITVLKKSPDRRIVKFLGRELSSQLLKYILIVKETPENFVLCYPPRTKKRVREYGFDQGKELAKAISKYTGIAAVDCFVHRGRKLQKNLNSVKRLESAKKSYFLKKGTEAFGKKFIIVDDIITTGATVNTCANLLLQNGAETVFPISVARTKLKKRKLRRKICKDLWFK